jgi:hypothetical protein
MDKVSTFASLNCRNFVCGSKRFLHSGMRTMDSIMALKDHFAFKFVHGSRLLRQSKDKAFVFKMFIDLLGSDMELVKKMQVGGDMENLWIMFDHVKRLKDWTIIACHVYANRNCKVLTIKCCDMHSEDYHPTLLNDVGHCKPCNVKVGSSKYDILAPTYKGLKKELRSTNNVEYEFWFCPDDIKRCISDTKKKYVLDAQHLASEDVCQSIKRRGVGTGGRRILITTEEGIVPSS